MARKRKLKAWERAHELTSILASLREAARGISTLSTWTCGEERAELAGRYDRHAVAESQDSQVRLAHASIELDRLYGVVSDEWRVTKEAAEREAATRG